MPAGREMDALIAEKVMSVDFGNRSRSVQRRLNETLPKYSEDIAAAGEVVDKAYIHALRRIVNDEPDRPALWQALIYADLVFSGIGETLPLAICRAALLAVLR